MFSYRNAVRAAASVAVIISTPALGQNSSARPDPLVGSVQQGAAHIRGVFKIAADSMTAADYAFKPTPEVRSFGQLLAHVADTNYWFCAGAIGEKAPVDDAEKTKTTREEIQKVLAESFDYCERAFASMSDEKNARALRKFRGGDLPALVLLNFRNYHSLLHWGKRHHLHAAPRQSPTRNSVRSWNGS